MARKYVIETFGCQMNVHDAERMAGLLEQAGYEPGTSADTADVVVLNTCSVRERAEEKLFSRLGELRPPSDSSPVPRVLAVTGCVAQQEGAAIAKRAPFVDLVVGTQALKQLPSMLARAWQSSDSSVRVDVNPYEDVSFPLGVVRRGDPTRAYITIIEGCNDYCAFCVVPYTRGHERMRPAAQILAEAHEAARSGRREIQLLGQIVNHYEAPDDPSCDFAGLLGRVSDVPGIERIRFASPHPRHVTPRLIGAIRDLPKVCKHLHLPVQSGSTRVLAAMRRRHTREQYLDLLDRLRAEVPGLSLSTDLIVGFPGETQSDFDDTLALLDRAQFESIFSFKYSPRPNTLAAKRLVDDVPEPEKSRRLELLQQVQRGIQTALHERAVGTVQTVLVDSVSRRREHEMSGRTTGNTVVNFPGEPEAIGRFADVLIERVGPHSLWGTVQQFEQPGGRTCSSR